MTEQRPGSYDSWTIDGADHGIEIDLLLGPSHEQRRPVILMPGSLGDGTPPAWSRNLVARGYGLAAFRPLRDPDPDPARRPQWLHFDQRFAHSYAVMGRHAPDDAALVMDALGARPDVAPDRFGWMGSSSTGIPGLAVAVHEPRLAALLAFVATGSYRSWLASWHTHGLWQGDGDALWQGDALWPETEAVLDTHDPLLHVGGLFPTAVLLVGGGADRVVDPATAEEFIAAARPSYVADPDRLRHVVYQGVGHNLPADLVPLYAEHWFGLYLHPTQPPPAAAGEPATLADSVVATQINAADHRDVVGAQDT
jgi:dienelactone hydrolase